MGNVWTPNFPTALDDDASLPGQSNLALLTDASQINSLKAIAIALQRRARGPLNHLGTSVQGVSGAPVSVWQFDGGASALADRMGNVGNLTWNNGATANIYAAVNGLVGKVLRVSGTDRWYLNGDPDLVLLGDLTLEVLHMPIAQDDQITDAYLISYGEHINTHVSTANQLYSLRIDSTTYQRLKYKCQTGGSPSTDHDTLFDHAVTGGQVEHTTLTRDAASGDVKLYSGRTLIQTVAGTTLPEDGSYTGTMFGIGGNVNGGATYRGLIFGARIWGTKLSDDDVARCNLQVSGLLP